MNEQNMNRVNTLQDVYLRLPQLYSDSSAKAYAAAFKRVEKLTGQPLAHLAAEEKAWADLTSGIVWAGHFKGRTQQAAERAFESWRGKIGAAIRRARAQPAELNGSNPKTIETIQMWDLIHGYVKVVENSFDAEGLRTLPNMSSLSISNLRARLKAHLPENLNSELAEATLLSLPADKAASFRRSMRFFDKLISERDRHGPIAALLPEKPLGPLRSLRDAPIQWTAFPDSFRASMERMIKVAIRGHAPRQDPLENKLGADPLADRRAARKNRRKPVRSPDVARKSYKAALSWLARHGYPDRDAVYVLSDVSHLMTAETIDAAVARYAARTKADAALIDVQATSSLGTYLATLSTLARTNRLDDGVLHAIEDARWDSETRSPYSGQMSSVREVFVKKIDRDPELVRIILSGPQVLMKEAQRELNKWDQLSSHARSQALHIAMAAAMLSLQLARPLRTKNINQITIAGPAPELTAPRGDVAAWLDLSRKEIKNNRSVENALPESTWHILSVWIDHGRLRWLELNAGNSGIGTTHLFPGMTGAAPICRQTLNKAWNKGVTRLGLTGLTPHMMRHVAATVFLARHPGNYGAVADLLGDRPETVEAFYSRGAGQAAARLFAEVMEELDPNLKLGRRAR